MESGKPYLAVRGMRNNFVLWRPTVADCRGKVQKILKPLMKESKMESYNAWTVSYSVLPFTYGQDKDDDIIVQLC